MARVTDRSLTDHPVSGYTISLYKAILTVVALVIHDNHLGTIASLLFRVSRLQFHALQHIVGHEESDCLRQLR
jgi:hypothetical protein